MAVKIRLWQQGCKNNISYRIVVADSRSPRDGKYLEAIGWYNPCAKNEEQQAHVHEDRLQHWLSVGAQLSPTVLALAKKRAAGVMQTFIQAREDRRANRARKQKA
jgi:small subunit ribosomal protein S16